MNPYLASLPENTAEGTKILTVVTDDPDKDSVLKYSILTPRGKKNPKFPFAIDPDTGVIELIAKVDRESTDWINFTVVAEDGSNSKKRVSTVPVLIRIIDVNDVSDLPPLVQGPILTFPPFP